MTDPAPLTVSEAQQRIVERIEPLEAERISLQNALGRTLAAPLRARRDLPPWDNSAMDGYAVRAADVTPGDALPVAIDVPAGSPPEPLPAASAARIMTGAPLPEGADSVVPVEATSGPSGDREYAGIGERVRFADRPAPGDHVRRRGEDVTRDAVVVDAGEVMDAPRIAMAAAVGASVVSVVRRPQVAIVSTGDELVDLDATDTTDRIINGNAYGLASSVAASGGVPRILPIVPDDAAATREAVSRALRADAVLTIGGVSMGDRDHVRSALEAAGVEIVFWRVAVRPGGPFAFGRAPGVTVFALPGNPVSALVTFDLFARPGLLRLAGRRHCFRRTLKARLADDVSTRPEKAYYLRCRLTRDDQGWLASVVANQSSGALSGLVEAEGLAVVPQGVADVGAGSWLDVLPLGERVAWQEEAP